MSNEDYKEIASRLRALMVAMSWNRSKLAREFGVSHAAISHWENGTNKMRGPALKLLNIFENRIKARVNAK